MAITDLEKAKACLSRIGYYRLSAYWYPFRESVRFTDLADRREKTLEVLDDFKPGTDFSTVLDFYVFDKKLRMIVLDALERVEVAIRTRIAIVLGARDPHAHRDPALLHGKFARRPKWRNATETKHDEWIRRLDEKARRSNEEFAKHFRRKYQQDHLPIWMAVELWDFGTLSHFFAGMTVADKSAIAGHYGLPPGSHSMMETWLRTLNEVRNTCAHHSRLWNQPLVNQPSWPSHGQIADMDHVVGKTHSLSRLYAALLMLRFLLRSVHPSSNWAVRLAEHVATLPSSPIISLNGAGFPQDWEDQPPWTEQSYSR